MINTSNLVQFKRIDIKDMTLRDVQAMIDEAKMIFIDLGYTELQHKAIHPYFKYSTVRALATTHKVNECYYEIYVNRQYQKVTSPQQFRSTILHEVAHCIYDGMKHTGNWKIAVNKANAVYSEKLDFALISRCGGGDEYHEIMKSKRLHQITCNKCKHVYTWERKSKIVNACIKGTATCSCGSKSFTYKYLG